MIIKLVQCLCLNIKIYKKHHLVILYFDNDFHQIKKISDDVKDDDDFNNSKIYKVYKDTNDV